MFHKLLVAIDNSVIAKYVFQESLGLATAINAKLMLLHILSFEEIGSPNMPLLPSLEYYPLVNDKNIELYRKQKEAVEKQGLDLLRSHANEAIAAGISTEFTQQTGSPGKTICEFAGNWGADLIILGRRGRVGLSELVLGSVSNYVLHHAPCSVLTVQNPTKTNTQSAINIDTLSSTESEVKKLT